MPQLTTHDRRKLDAVAARYIYAPWVPCSRVRQKAAGTLTGDARCLWTPTPYKQLLASAATSTNARLPRCYL